MTILITGYKGFIGSNLVKKLSNHTIIGLDLKDGNDVLNPTLLEDIFSNNNIDVVIHLAAIAGVGYSISHSEEVLHNNIVGFDTIAKCAIKHKVKHFVYASSSSVYGDNGKVRSPYAVSKAANELQADVYSNLSDTKFTGLRFFTVYGEGIRQDLAMYKFINAINNDKPITVYGDGNQRRDFTYIDDITEAIKLIVESDKDWKNEVFDIGYGSNVSINELLLILREITGKKVFDLVTYEDEKGYDVKETLADPNKLNEWFGFRPRYNIREGLKKMIYGREN